MRDLNQLATFAEVARRGSFAAAGRALGVPSSTVSARVQALESELGVRLLKRTTRQLALTEEGRLLHAEIADSVATLARCDQVLPGGATGLASRLRLTAPPDYPLGIISEAISTFRAEHPAISVDVTLTNRLLDFVTDGVDLAIRGNQVGGGGMVASRLPDVPFGLFASPVYLAGRRIPVSTADLSDHQVLLLHPGGDLRALMFPDLPLERRQAARAIAANSMTLLKQLAVDGHGVAVLPRHLCALEEKAGTLIRIAPAWSGGAACAVYLVYLSARDPTARVRILADHLRRAALANSRTSP